MREGVDYRTRCVDCLIWRACELDYLDYTPELVEGWVIILTPELAREVKSTYEVLESKRLHARLKFTILFNTKPLPLVKLAPQANAKKNSKIR